MIMRTFLFLMCTTLFSFTTENSFSQAKVDIAKDQLASVDQVFKIIKQQTNYNFLYPKKLFKNAPKVQLQKGQILVTKLLEKTLSNGKVSYRVTKENTIVIEQKSLSKVLQQQINISGKITDIAGEPLPGVTILLKGTNRATASTFNGLYTINAISSESILVFTSIGFEKQEVIVGNQTTINITLKESIGQLDEVVINAGYYKTSKKEATGSISKVTASDIEKQPVTNPLAALQGRMSGVNITQNGGVPGSSFDIEIRGRNSIGTPGSPPLYIIDGLPFSNESLSSNITSGNILPESNGFGASPLNSINSSDIESIEILKDADATAIYGSRGANGVVLITTKKGKSGKTQYAINTYSGVSTVTRNIELMKTEEYLEVRREGINNDGFGPFLNFPTFDAFWPDVKLWDQDRYTDWQKELIGGTAYSNDVQASMSGGNAATQFLISGGFHKETTVFPGDFNYKKASGRIQLNHSSKNDKFNLSFSTNYISDINNLGGSDLTFAAVNLAPNAPALHDNAGNLNWENGTWNNPLGKLEENYVAKTNNLIVNTLLDYKLFKGVSLKTNLGFNSFTLKETKATPSTFFDIVNNPNFNRSLILNNSSRQSWIIEPQLNWNVKFGNAKLDILAGATFQQRTNDQLIVRGSGFLDDSLITNMSAANSTEVITAGITEYNYNAFFGRINYNYDGKYIINITGRRDGSSRFGPGKQFANFGAIGAAWIFSNENMFKDNKFLSFGKLRASYGTTGSDNIGDYKFLDSYSFSNDYDGQNSLAPTQLFNNDFAWETNKKLEFAIELGLLNNGILLDVNYYRNRSSNQLIGLPLSALTGFNSITSNFDATVQNTGLEIELNTINVRKKDFTWRSNFNISIPKNELISFPGLEQSTFKNTLVVGESLDIKRVYESTGVDPDTGLWTFRDFNEDGDFDIDDRQLIKSLTPKYYGGLSNSFTYKGFQLDFLFQFVKQEGRNYLGLTDFIPGYPGNSPRSFLQDVWHESGDIASIQKPSAGFNGQAFLNLIRYRNSNSAYTDASFIRLKNLAFSYQISEEWTKVFNARVYVQGQNLLTITDYFGLDPENQSLSNLPPLKTISFGLQLTF